MLSHRDREKLSGPLATLSRCKEKLSRKVRDRTFTVVFGNFTDDGIEVKNSLHTEFPMIGVTVAIR